MDIEKGGKSFKRQLVVASVFSIFTVFIIQHQNCSGPADAGVMSLSSTSGVAKSMILQFANASHVVSKGKSWLSVNGVCSATGAASNRIRWTFKRVNTSSNVASGESLACKTGTFSLSATFSGVRDGTYIFNATLIGYNTVKKEMGRSDPIKFHIVASTKPTPAHAK